MKKGDSHTSGKEAGLRETPKTEDGPGMQILGPGSLGYSNSLILRAFELGLKREKPRRGQV